MNSQDNSQNPQFYNIRILFNDVQEKFFSTRKPGIEEAIVILGNSGIGKTTLYHMLNNPNKLQVKQMHGQLKIINTDPKNSAEIGNSSKSQTTQPNIIVAKIQGKKGVKQIYIIDCPGFEDSLGDQQDIANAYLVMTVFKIFKKVRFLLCVPQYSIFDCPRYSELMKSFTHFFSNFIVTLSNQKNIIDATSLVVTRVTSQNTKKGVQGLMQRLNNFLKDIPKKKIQNEKKLLQNIIQTKRVYFIPKVQKQFDQFYLKLGPQIIQKQMSYSQFLIDHQKDLKFQLSQATYIKKMYKRIFDNLKKPIQILNLASYQIIKSMEKDFKHQKKTYQYHERIEEFCINQENDIYAKQRNEQQAQLYIERYKKICKNSNYFDQNNQKYSLENLSNNFERITLNQINIKEYEKPFVQIQFRRKILKMNKYLKDDVQKIKQVQKQKNFQTQNRGSIEKIFQFARRLFGRQVCKTSDNTVSYFPLLVQYITSFANQIFHYGYPNQKGRQYFIHFAFIISRNLLQLEIIQNLSSSVDKNYPQLLNILLLDEKKVINSEKIYLHNYKLPQNPSIQYLDKAQNVISQINVNDNQQAFPKLKQYRERYKKKNQQNDQDQFKDSMEQSKNQNNIDLKFKKVQLDIQINWKKGIKLSQIKKDRQAFQKCQIARRSYERLYQQKNKDSYIFVKKDFYQKLGNMSMQLQYYDLAIEYFKVIEYQNSIRKCFDLKKTRNYLNVENIFKIEQDFAKYLASLLEFDQAIKNLTRFLETLDLSKQEHIEYDKKIKTLRNQFRTQQFKNKYMKPHQERYQNKIIDYRPDQQLIAKLAKINDNYLKINSYDNNNAQKQDPQKNTNTERKNNNNNGLRNATSAFLDVFNASAQPKNSQRDPRNNYRNNYRNNQYNRKRIHKDQIKQQQKFSKYSDY